MNLTNIYWVPALWGSAFRVGARRIWHLLSWLFQSVKPEKAKALLKHRMTLPTGLTPTAAPHWVYLPGSHLGWKEKPHFGRGGGWKGGPGWEGPLMGIVSTLSAGAEAVSLRAGSCQCNQNHPWQLQSGEGREEGTMGMTSGHAPPSASTPLTLIHSLTHEQVFIAGLPRCVCQHRECWSYLIC